MTFAQSLLQKHYDGESETLIRVVGYVEDNGEVYPRVHIQTGDNTAFHAILKGGQIVRTDE